MSKLIFDFFNPDVINNPYAYYDFFRDNKPVYIHENNLWVVTDYNLVSEILKSKNYLAINKEYYARLGQPFPIEMPIYNSIEWQNPPNHRRIRKLVMGYFTPEKIKQLEATVEPTVNGILHKIYHQGSADMVSDIAYPYSTNFAFNLMGIPAEFYPKLTQKIRWQSQAFDLGIADEMFEELFSDSNELTTVFKDVFEQLQASPNDGLMSYFLQNVNAGDLNEYEAIANCHFIFLASYATTMNAITLSTLTLHNNPEQRKLLIDKPELINSAVEELLRLNPSVQYVANYAKEDAKVGGVLIKKDQLILPFLGAANRDPNIFKNPHECNFEREEVRNLSFGGGPHLCIGANLARMQMRGLFSRMLPMLDNFKVDDPHNLAWENSMIVRGLKRMPISWSVDSKPKSYPRAVYTARG